MWSVRRRGCGSAVTGSSLVASGGELDVLERQRLDVAGRRGAVAGVLPDRNVAEVDVVAHGLAVGLVLDAEMPATALLADQRVVAHQLGEPEEVGDPAGLLERLVEAIALAEHGDVAPELLAQRRD